MPSAGCSWIRWPATVARLQHGERTERCMRIENRWPDGEAFFRSLNKKGRNNHTRGKRILAELGGEVSFRSMEPGEDAGALLDEIIRSQAGLATSQ